MTRQVPGPWTISGYQSVGGYKEIIVDEDGSHIATVFTSDDCYDHARILAAAPEMLKALKVLCKGIEEGTDAIACWVVPEDDYKMGLKAIAKAEGEDAP